MIRKLYLVIALAGSAGCASIGGSPAVDYQGTSYRLVTGRQLRTAFVGNKIRRPEPQQNGDNFIATTWTCDEFWPDGRYRTCSDRVPVMIGTYAVRNDRVCATVRRQC